MRSVDEFFVYKKSLQVTHFYILTTIYGSSRVLYLWPQFYFAIKYLGSTILGLHPPSRTIIFHKDASTFCFHFSVFCAGREELTIEAPLTRLKKLMRLG